MREFRTIVDYNDGRQDEALDLIYGPALHAEAEAEARAAAKRWKGRDFDEVNVFVESREVTPWETVLMNHVPASFPPHPEEAVDAR